MQISSSNSIPGYISSVITSLLPRLLNKFLINPILKSTYQTGIPPKNISDKVRDICRFLQPRFISSTLFEEKLSFPTANHHRIYKFIVDLIPKDWKHILRT